jgi:DNA-binding IscR family transcriptional regulator
LGGFLVAERGNAGGYTLSKPPIDIKIKDVLFSLGGKLYDDDFCKTHTGAVDLCTNSIDCSVRSLWRLIQDAIEGVLVNMTLQDLLGSENNLFELFGNSGVTLIENS